MNMKNYISLGIIFFAISGQLALACPTLNPEAGYTEVALPCTDSGVPDFSQSAVVNQRESSGGECRTVPESGKFYSIVGLNLLLTDSVGNQQRLGVLIESPSCYQTDHGGPYYGKWV